PALRREQSPYGTATLSKPGKEDLAMTGPLMMGAMLATPEPQAFALDTRREWNPFRVGISTHRLIRAERVTPAHRYRPTAGAPNVDTSVAHFGQAHDRC